jgi:hypothetical protein
MDIRRTQRAGMPRSRLCDLLQAYLARARTTPVRRPPPRERRPRQQMAEVELDWPEDEAPRPLVGDRRKPVVSAVGGVFIGLVVGLLLHSAAAPSDPAAPPPAVAEPAAPLPGVRDFQRGRPGIAPASPSEPRPDCANGSCTTTGAPVACAQQIAPNEYMSWESVGACGYSSAPGGGGHIATGGLAGLWADRLAGGAGSTPATNG